MPIHMNLSLINICFFSLFLSLSLSSFVIFAFSLHSLACQRARGISHERITGSSLTNIVVDVNLTCHHQISLCKYINIVIRMVHMCVCLALCLSHVGKCLIIFHSSLFLHLHIYFSFISKCQTIYLRLIVTIHFGNILHEAAAWASESADEK